MKRIIVAVFYLILLFGTGCGTAQKITSTVGGAFVTAGKATSQAVVTAGKKTCKATTKATTWVAQETEESVPNQTTEEK